MNIINRTTHDVQQSTGPWLRLREGFDTASEAPSALGVGKYTTRAALLRKKKTRIDEEHSQATLDRFAAGHVAETCARPLAEAITGDLYPTTMTVEVDGLRLLASLDGQTLDGDVIWETKQWNEELAADVIAGTLDAHYTVQMDQELLVSGAQRCLFTCTDGTPERFVHCWYEASTEKFSSLIAGWHQFNADLAIYVPQPRAEEVVADTLEALPALSVRMDGALAVQSNLPAFGVALRAFVEKIPKAPKTDNEFATVDRACKALKLAEDELQRSESSALASMADVEAMRRMVADFRNLARDTRLASEKMVARRKVEIKEQAVYKSRQALDLHISSVNAEIAPMRLQAITADFVGAIKGLKSFDSMQDALDTALAAAKITADTQARAIRANLAVFHERAAGVEFLFADLGQVVHKAADDFAALVQARIGAHQAAEAAKEVKRKADEAARIAQAAQRAREEEAARIATQQAEADRIAAYEREKEDARLAEEQRQRDAARAEQERIDRAACVVIESAPEAAHESALPPVEPVAAGVVVDCAEITDVQAFAVDAVQAVVALLPPSVEDTRTTTLGALCDEFGPGFKMTQEFVSSCLSVQSRNRSERNAVLYTMAQRRTALTNLRELIDLLLAKS